MFSLHTRIELTFTFINMSLYLVITVVLGIHLKKNAWFMIHILYFHICLKKTNEIMWLQWSDIFIIFVLFFSKLYVLIAELRIKYDRSIPDGSSIELNIMKWFYMALWCNYRWITPTKAYNNNVIIIGLHLQNISKVFSNCAVVGCYCSLKNISTKIINNNICGVLGLIFCKELFGREVLIHHSFRPASVPTFSMWHQSVC